MVISLHTWSSTFAYFSWCSFSYGRTLCLGHFVCAVVCRNRKRNWCIRNSRSRSWMISWIPWRMRRNSSIWPSLQLLDHPAIACFRKGALEVPQACLSWTAARPCQLSSQNHYQGVCVERKPQQSFPCRGCRPRLIYRRCQGMAFALVWIVPGGWWGLWVGLISALAWKRMTRRAKYCISEVMLASSFSTTLNCDNFIALNFIYLFRCIRDGQFWTLKMPHSIVVHTLGNAVHDFSQLLFA